MMINRPVGIVHSHFDQTDCHGDSLVRTRMNAYIFWSGHICIPKFDSRYAQSPLLVDDSIDVLPAPIQTS